jgi:tRNA:m4X modification enzyme
MEGDTRAQIVEGIRSTRRTCAHYDERRGQRCNHTAARGADFCGEHSPASTRVQCPFGNHTIAASKLSRHLRTCTDALKVPSAASGDWFLPDVNAGAGPDAALPAADPGFDPRGRGDTPAARRVAHATSLGPEGLSDLIRRVQEAVVELRAGAANEHVTEAEPPRSSPVDRPQDHSIPFSSKHGRQQASILGHMRRRGLVEDSADATFIELGAGKGYLALALAEAVPLGVLVLVDCRSFRLKADRSMRHLAALHRLRCDIKDFAAGRAPGVAGGACWVAFGKHLCGAATDFSLRCCTRETAEHGGSLRGLALATCCHHRCCWRHFVAQEEFLELGFLPEEFELVSWMSGWALCGHEAPPGQGIEGNGDCSDEGEAGSRGIRTGEERQVEDTWRPHHLLPRGQRIMVGQDCKRLIDALRLLWLQRQGLDAETVLYVPPEVSGENKMLLATTTGSSRIAGETPGVQSL